MQLFLANAGALNYTAILSLYRFSQYSQQFIGPEYSCWKTFILGFVLNLSYTNALTFSTELKGLCFFFSCWVTSYKCLQGMQKTMVGKPSWYARRKITVVHDNTQNKLICAVISVAKTEPTVNISENGNANKLVLMDQHFSFIFLSGVLCTHQLYILSRNGNLMFSAVFELHAS